MSRCAAMCGPLMCPFLLFEVCPSNAPLGPMVFDVKDLSPFSSLSRNPGFDLRTSLFVCYFGDSRSISMKVLRP